MNLVTSKTIYYKLSLDASEIDDNFEPKVKQFCKDNLNKKIYNDFYIDSINNININNNIKINNDKLIIRCYCECQIIDLIVKSTFKMKINDVNKMGAYYKYEKICIFIPQHFIKTNININDIVNIKLLGKRVEDNIICIADFI